MRFYFSVFLAVFISAGAMGLTPFSLPKVDSVEEEGLDEFEKYALSLRLLGQAHLQKTQQYDFCTEGVMYCAQEVDTSNRVNEYIETVTDPFYGYQVFFLIDKSLSHRPGAQRTANQRSPQTLYVYVREGKNLRFHSVHAVSTGSEPTPGSRDTREGFMRVQNAQQKYVSRKYGENMPYSLWFESEYGTAIHETRADWCASSIGMRASAGCVRLCPGEAQPIFSLATSYGTRPIVLLDKRSGIPIMRRSDQPMYGAIQGGVLSMAPKVIQGYPVFVRIIDGNTPANVQEIEAILRNPTQGFQRYFVPVSKAVIQNLGA